MKLRMLQDKDADLMLEWMHDESVVRFFRFNSLSKTKEDVLEFIHYAQKPNEMEQHFAIVNDEDEYLGTISLKNIDLHNKNAEYAICVRKAAMGKNVAREGTNLILNYAFHDLQLEKVYLNVLTENVRAVKFYEKYGFQFEGEFKKHLMHQGTLKDIRYYAAFNQKK